MKIDIETEDVERIAARVAEILLPHVTGSGKREDPDHILDIKGLSEYLGVTTKWIHERTHLKQIPHHKLSNKQLRFRKRDIDKWIESHKVPAVYPFPGKLKKPSPHGL